MTKPLIDLDALKGKVLNSEGVAELLGLTPDSIRRRIRRGQIPARKVPGEKSYAISGDDLARYLLGETPQRLDPKGLTPPGSVDPNADFYKLPLDANARFKAWFDAQGVMIKDIADKTGLGGDKISRILQAKRAITRATLDKLEQAYGEDMVQYLITGKKTK